jgi:hypothetical protein
VLHATKGLSLRLRPHQGAEAKKIAVSTLVADIGVRGTEFWGGPLDKYGVLKAKSPCQIRQAA